MRCIAGSDARKPRPKPDVLGWAYVIHIYDNPYSEQD